MAENKVLTGRCHCSSITYEVNGEIIDTSYCHCRACQRASGTFKVPFVTVHPGDFKFITGKPNTFRSSSGDPCDVYGQWYFCQNCGTHIYWESNDNGDLTIFAGTIDDFEVFQDQD